MTQNIVKKINAEFERRKNINKSYSLRGYAKHMGVSVSILSRVMNGKMPMTINLLKRMSVPLALSPDDYRSFEEEIISRKHQQASELVVESEQRQLLFDEFSLIQDWYNMVILEMVGLDDFEANEKWIAKKLNISEEEAFLAIERLVRMELLVQKKDGTFQKASTFISLMQQNFSTVAMRNRQKQVLARASAALDMIDFDKRDQSAITLVVDSTLLPEIKNKIKQMRRSLANYIVKNSNKRDQVYELSISFFPWSH